MGGGSGEDIEGGVWLHILPETIILGYSVTKQDSFSFMRTTYLRE
jgi:hypothetical protein